MEQMQAQAEHVGTEIVMDQIAKVDLKKRPFGLKGEFGRHLYLRRADHLHRRAGALARHRVGGDVQGLRRLGLRHLRRLLLQGQGRRGRRRRQHRGRGGDLPDQLRQARHRRAPARSLPRREDPAGPPVQEPEDRGDLGHAVERDRRHGEPEVGHRRQAQEHQDRRKSPSARPTACSSPSATRRRRSCSRASSR